MPGKLFLEIPANFSFRHTVYSHGWSDLLPFELDEDKWKLSYVFKNGKGRPFTATVSESGKRRLQIDYTGKADEKKLLADVAHILRLDDDLDQFYTLTNAEPRLAWIAGSNAG